MDPSQIAQAMDQNSAGWININGEFDSAYKHTQDGNTIYLYVTAGGRDMTVGYDVFAGHINPVEVDAEPILQKSVVTESPEDEYYDTFYEVAEMINGEDYDSAVQAINAANAI